MKRRPLSSAAPSTQVEVGEGEGDPREKLNGGELDASWRIMAALVALRALSALLSQTAFAPDEYYQALEPAHHVVFGYGHLTWEWRWALRGFTHPLLYAVLFKVLALLQLDWPQLLILLPRLLHVPLAVLGDWHVLKLAALLFGARTGKYALLCNVASWFTFYCMTRTLSNSVETALTPAILYHWTVALDCAHTDKNRATRSARLYLVLVGVSCLVRPTGGVLWAPLVLLHLARDPRCAFRETLTMGLLTLLWSVAVDYCFYGRIVIVHWNFFQFNVLEGLSALFGTHPWHWYFTEDCAVLFFTLLPLVLHGVWLVWRGGGGRVGRGGGWRGRELAPFAVALWELVLHSFLSHKEHRLVFPIVPLGCVYAGYSLMTLLMQYKHKFVKAVLCSLLLANVPMALYFSLVHQRGSLAIMDFLRQDISSNSSVLFLMPCHSTPLYSHIHRDIPLRFLECPPPISPEYVDVTEVFYSAPDRWLTSEYPTAAAAPLPTHLVMYDVLKPLVRDFISDHGYREVARVFHSHFPEGARQGTHMLVLRTAR